MKVSHRNELNFKIKALRTNLNQEMRNRNEKLCKTTEVMGLELRYLGIYVVLLTRKRSHNENAAQSFLLPHPCQKIVLNIIMESYQQSIFCAILCMRKSRCSLICGVPFFLPALGHLEAIESNQFWQLGRQVKYLGMQFGNTCLPLTPLG